jgi:molybdopterin converting factor small subunit
MTFVLELPTDIASKIGATQVMIDLDEYPKALRQLALNKPEIHSLLINSKNELRQTIRCSVNGELLDTDSKILDGTRVKLFFISAGG